MVDIKGKKKKIGGGNAIKHINKLISNNLTKDEIQLLKEYYIIDNNINNINFHMFLVSYDINKNYYNYFSDQLKAFIF